MASPCDHKGPSRRGVRPRPRSSAQGARDPLSSSGPPATASQSTRSRSSEGSSLEAVGDELLERSRGGGFESRIAQLPSGRACRLPSPLTSSRISSAPRSRSASTISSKKKGLPATRGMRSAHTCRTPSRTPSRISTRRTCSSVDSPRSSIRIKLSSNGLRRPLVRACDEDHPVDRKRIGLPNELAQELDALAIGPLHAFEHDDQRLLQRERCEQVSEPALDDPLPRARVVIVRPSHIAVRGEFGEAGHHGVVSVSMGSAPACGRDDRANLVERFVTREADDIANELTHGAQGELDPDGGALDAHEPGVRGELRCEGCDEDGLSNAELADDGAAHEHSAAPLADRSMIGGMQVGLFDLPPFEIARRVGGIAEPLLAREASARERRCASCAGAACPEERQAQVSAHRPSRIRDERGGRRHRLPTCGPGGSPSRRCRRGTTQGPEDRSERGALEDHGCLSRCHG